MRSVIRSFLYTNEEEKTKEKEGKNGSLMSFVFFSHPVF